ncbi:MAG: hypothetical protein AB7E05_09945 [Sphingobium sp.]
MHSTIAAAVAAAARVREKGVIMGMARQALAAAGRETSLPVERLPIGRRDAIDAPQHLPYAFASDRFPGNGD